MDKSGIVSSFFVTLTAQMGFKTREGGYFLYPSGGFRWFNLTKERTEYGAG